MNEALIASAWEKFLQFSPGTINHVEVFFAPGRVNLIGEHTDYNGGFVFPAALTLGTVVMVRPRKDNLLRFSSTSFATSIEVPIGALRYHAEYDFANYPLGMLWALEKVGVPILGADYFFASDLPSGAGLSSSASIEVGTGVAATALAKASIDRIKLVKLAQKAENDFVGVNCGIMDQFAVGMGEADHAILLDCNRLDYSLVPFVAPSYRLVITNTNKRRELADSKYNERRAQCEQGLAALQRVVPDITYLAQLTPQQLVEVESVIVDPVIKKRVRHVVTEHARTKRSVELLRDDNFAAFGQLMNESHVSLRDDYEVTGRELDALAKAAWTVNGCVGSRMTGAGFGGCTVSLVKENALQEFMQVVGDLYHEETGLTASFYTSALGDGAKKITKEAMSLCRF